MHSPESCPGARRLEPLRPYARAEGVHTLALHIATSAAHGIHQSCFAELLRKLDKQDAYRSQLRAPQAKNAAACRRIRLRRPIGTTCGVEAVVPHFSSDIRKGVRQEICPVCATGSHVRPVNGFSGGRCNQFRHPTDAATKHAARHRHLVGHVRHSSQDENPVNAMRSGPAALIANSCLPMGR